MLHFASQADADKHAVSHQIQALRVTKRRLTSAQQTRLASLRQQLNALHAPVYKLPDDLLSLIFEFGSEDGQDTAFRDLVTKIVSRWRRVALGTPRIWSHITIKVPFARTRGAGDMRSAQIKRSGNCLVNVEIVVLSDLTSAAAMSALSDTMAGVYSRCEHLSVTYKRSRTARGYIRPDGPPAYFASFGHMPALKSLEISNISIRDKGQYTGHGLQPLLDLLRSSPDIESLELNVLMARVQEEAPPRLELARLREITMTDLGRFGFNVLVHEFMCFGLLSHIHTPALAYLSIESRCCILTMPQYADNLANLVRLRIEGAAFDCNVVLGLLCQVPRLEQLYCVGVDSVSQAGIDWEGVLDAQDVDAERLVPNLAVASFEQCNLDLSGLIRLLLVVRGGDRGTEGFVEVTKTLDALHIIRCPKIPPAFYEWLQGRATDLKIERDERQERSVAAWDVFPLPGFHWFPDSDEEELEYDMQDWLFAQEEAEAIEGEQEDDTAPH